MKINHIKNHWTIVVVVVSFSHFGNVNVPHPWHLPIVNHHEAKFIMNQTSIDHEAYE
jgi:hypothetical protein